MERENLAGDAKGKGTSGSNCEAESTDAPERGGLPRSSDEASVMLVERRGQAIAICSGQPGGTSRMTRECQVRICERLGVKFPGPTRHLRRIDLLPKPDSFRNFCTAPKRRFSHEQTYATH